MKLDLTQPVRVAAVQMHGRVADIAYNLEQAERLARGAFTAGARIVALPEFFTTPISFDQRLCSCDLPPDNEAIDLLKSLAARYGGYIGGSMLLRRDADVYNTYVFVQPDGAIFTHDKDLPTMWENAFYVGGCDDGVMETEIGPVGAAVCWELIRTQTVKRLRDKIKFAMTGSNWWSTPDNWSVLAPINRLLRATNRKLAAAAPVKLAKLLGVPVIHAGQTGAFECRFLLTPGRGATVRYCSHFVGETKIVDARGNVVAAMSAAEGAGVVAADVLLQPGRPSESLRETHFWIPRLPAVHLAMWHQQNACGKRFYRNMRGR